MVALAGVEHVEKLLGEVSGKKQRLRVPPIAILDALLQGHRNSRQSRDLCHCIGSHRHRMASLGARKEGGDVRGCDGL